MEENLEVMEQEYEAGEVSPTDETGDPGKAGGFSGERRSIGNEGFDDCDDDGWDESPAEAEQGEKQADQPELFTLKNRDETRQVTRQELIAMAQKGWDYDKVRQERDQLRQYRQAMEQIRPPVKAIPKAEELSRRVKANAQRQDMERFLQTYPTVKAEDIPRAVWGQVARGVPLVSAYAMHENQQMKIQLAAQRQDQLNRARTPGALAHNIGGELDEIDRMWTEDD